MHSSLAAKQGITIAYRPDIDGLRAIAVLAVVAFHAFPERLPGGFVGVDVFFVVSGVLISSIIMHGIDHGTFTYQDFYARRIRRIFPALILVLVASLALGLWLLPPDQNLPLGKEVLAGALFFYNFLVLQASGYFDATVTQNALLHLWSLGVEEQFYMLWPFAVALIWRFRRNRFTVVAVLALASFVLNVALIGTYPSATFYLPFTRFWQLLCGAMLAMESLKSGTVLQGWGTTESSIKNVERLRNACSFLGLGLIFGSIIVITDGSDYPGWRAIFPTAGAALLITAGPASWINLNILSRPSVVFVGLISYPLYMWHWPALHWAPIIAQQVDLLALNVYIIDSFAFMGVENSSKIAGWVILRAPKILALQVSFALAIVTYVAIERRVRASADLKKTTWVLLIALVVAVPVFAGLQIALMQYKMNGDGRGDFFRRFDMSAPDSAYKRSTLAAYHLECSFYGGPGDVKPVLAVPCYTPSARPVVMLWGDSLAMHLRPGLDALQAMQQKAGKQLEVLQITSGSCHAALKPSDRRTDEARGCNLANSLAASTIAKAKPDVVIVAQAIGHLDTNWPNLVAEILTLGARHVIVVGPVPQWTQGLPQLVAYKYWPIPPLRLQTDLQRGMFTVDKQLRKQIVDSPQVSYVSAVDFFCDQSSACLVSAGADRTALTSHDSGHLTPWASVAFAEGSLDTAILRFIGR